MEYIKKLSEDMATLEQVSAPAGTMYAFVSGNGVVIWKQEQGRIARTHKVGEAVIDKQSYAVE